MENIQGEKDSYSICMCLSLSENILILTFKVKQKNYKGSLHKHVKTLLGFMLMNIPNK